MKSHTLFFRVIPEVSTCLDQSLGMKWWITETLEPVEDSESQE